MPVTTLHIHGMHCASCEVLIERRLKKLPGIETVHVNHVTGYAEITHSQPLNLETLNNAIKNDGYTVEYPPFHPLP